MDIIAKRMWNFEAVRLMCIKHDWYTEGTNEEYSAMADFVRENDPTYANMHTVAQNIVDHSDLAGWYTVADVMFVIERECVMTCFEVYKGGAYGTY